MAIILAYDRRIRSCNISKQVNDPSYRFHTAVHHITEERGQLACVTRGNQKTITTITMYPTCKFQVSASNGRIRIQFGTFI
ncbi:MAG: hypothetical protein XE11_0210 [Methanomicrobiales archaeon 53_19]|jgi:hypothetical protein|nr:MAG: hypothetical protein XE11_0210 [Methanomicrobiales archaeon 53_19]